MDLLGSLVETFGPFLIPVVVFALGFVGYLFLLGLTRLLGNSEVVSLPEGDEEEN